MTAPLYDVKARLSEYVTIAENGDAVEITKHGVPTAVIISIKQYADLKEEYYNNHRPSFLESLKKWRAETGGLTQEDADEYANIIEQLVQEDKKFIDNGVNPWN